MILGYTKKCNEQKKIKKWKKYYRYKGVQRALYAILGALTVVTLHQLAKRLNVYGHWQMRKPELIEALAKNRKKIIAALVAIGVFYASVKYLRRTTGKPIKVKVKTI